ncbi:sigma-70 family RNA polymerase sigma factor [bacterium]|nr:sigma-70 family RNA polymerase sigma factor [bacterium]
MGSVIPTGNGAVEQETERQNATAEGMDPELWVEEYGDDLFRYAIRRVSNRTEAEDLVQETLIAALKAQEKFRSQSTPKTWLIGILKHKVMDYYRKKGRELNVQDVEEVCQVSDKLFDRKGMFRSPGNDWGENPEALFERKEFWGVLGECISNLPERLLPVFQLRMLQDRNTDDVCEELGITSNNMWVMLHRARLRLKTCLDAKWFSREEGGKTC